VSALDRKTETIGRVTSTANGFPKTGPAAVAVLLWPDNSISVGSRVFDADSAAQLASVITDAVSRARERAS
jgi:hypothetical protein